MSLDATSEADISPSGRVIIFGSEKGTDVKTALESRQRFSPHCPTCYRLHCAAHIRIPAIAHTISRHTGYVAVFASNLFISGETEPVVISTPSQRRRSKKFSGELIGKMHLRRSGYRQGQYFQDVRKSVVLITGPVFSLRPLTRNANKGSFGDSPFLRS